MTIIEAPAAESQLTYRQRTSHNLVILFSLIGLLIGFNLRESTLNAVTTYVNTQAGIRAEYPRSWLIDSQGDYIFRVRDVSQIGFKTTIQAASQPIGANTTARNVIDALTLVRAQTLSTYTVFEITPFLLPDEQAATSVTYTYVAAETNPFLESLPVVVEGQDILTISRGQAIIITFLSDSRVFQQNYPIFERFLSTLEF